MFKWRNIKKHFHSYDRKHGSNDSRRWLAISLLSIFILFTSLDPITTFSRYMVNRQKTFVLETSNFFFTSSLNLNVLTLDGDTGFTPINILTVSNDEDNNINTEKISYTITLEENDPNPIFDLYTDDGEEGKEICLDNTINDILIGGSSNTNEHALYLKFKDPETTLEASHQVTIRVASSEPYIRSYKFNVNIQDATNGMTEIGDTDIYRPDVEIPDGEIMVFKDDKYIYLTPDDLVNGTVVINDVVDGMERPDLLGGSLYIPESTGELAVGSNQTIDWDVQGNIIIEPNIAINNQNISVTMLSHNGDVIMNEITMTGGTANPYVVDITAENGSIEANGTTITSKSDGSGKINLVAQNDINISEAILESAGDQGINIQSTAGDINAEGADIKATGGSGTAVIKLESAGSINLDQATVASKVDLTISGVEGISAQSANITNSAYGKNINITSSNATIDLSSLETPERRTEVSAGYGNIYINARGDISIKSANIKASILWGMELKFVATDSGSTLRVQDAIVQGNSINAHNLTVEGTPASGTINP